MRQSVAGVTRTKYVFTDRVIHNHYFRFRGVCLSFNDVLEIQVSLFIPSCEVYYIKIEQTGSVTLCADEADIPKERDKCVASLQHEEHKVGYLHF